MSRTYTNTPPADHTLPLLTPRIQTPRKERTRIAYGHYTGKDLRLIRQRHLLTQTQFASMLNVSQNAISKYERGVTTLPFDLYPQLLMLDAPHMATGLAIVDLKTHAILRLF